MPNWCDCELRISGPKTEVDTCLSAIKDGDDAISFQKIKPIPPPLESTEGFDNAGEILFAAGILNAEQAFKRTGTEFMLNLCKLDTLDQLRAEMKKRHPDYEDRAKGFSNLIAETGATNWYDWTVDNWGTKWDASDAKIAKTYSYGNSGDELVVLITFDTAWSPPLPIIKELGTRYPSLDFRLVYYESGAGFHGIFWMLNGQIEKEDCGNYYGDRGR